MVNSAKLVALNATAYALQLHDDARRQFRTRLQPELERMANSMFFRIIIRPSTLNAEVTAR